MSQHTFSVQDWQRRDRPRQCLVAKPIQLTCWTKASDKEGGGFHYGSTEGLGRYQEPQLPVDLNQGFPDLYTPKDTSKGSPVEHVIQAVLHADRQQPQGSPSLLHNTQVLTYRNNLNKIFGTLFAAKDDWTVAACLHNNILFLDIIHTGDASFPDRDITTYYGYKFEVVCTARADGSDPATAPVDPTAEFATVVGLGLDGLNVLMAGEVDLMDENLISKGHQQGSLPPLNAYVELKTTKQLQHPGQRRTLTNFKWPKWWLQSFLAGIECIVMGSRDDHGNLVKVERLSVQELPGLARREQARWDAWQAIRLGADLLRWMIKMAQTTQQQHGGQPQHLRFSYSPGPDKTPGVIQCQVVEGGDLPARLQQVLG